MKVDEITYRNKDGFPPNICVQLLDWCNLTCKNCRANSSPVEKNRLLFEEIYQFILGMSVYGKWRISITGGEPFYWPELPALLKLLANLDFPFSVTTNGFSSKRMFEMISSDVWNKGTLYVSIDGLQKEHDFFRGNGTFNKAIDFLKYARPKVDKLNVNTVLYSDPFLWAKNLYYVLDNIGVNNWTIISPVGEGRFTTPLIDLPNYEIFYNTIKSLAVGNTTTSFLDFNRSEKVLRDIVFIDSDASVKLPGFTNPILTQPPIVNSHLSDPNICNLVFNSVRNFIESEKYIL